MTVTTILHKLTRRYYCSSSSSLGLVQVQLSNAKKMQHKLFARSLTPSPLLSKNSSDTTSRTICTSTLCDAHLSLSSSSSVLPKYEHLQKIHMQQVRRLGRKAGRMGQHIKTLNEMAHRDEHEKAKAKRSKKGKRGAKDKDEMSAEKKMNYNPSEIPAIQEDENETVFNSGNSDDNGNSGDEDAPSLPSKEEVKTRMMKVVYAMEDSFRAIRGGEATPELFDAVQVKAYGSMTPLNGVAQVVINTPTMASITCFDPEVTTAVRDAVRDMAGMNFNPRIEEGVVIVPIPRVSAETRKVRFCKIL